MYPDGSKQYREVTPEEVIRGQQVLAAMLKARIEGDGAALQFLCEQEGKDGDLWLVLGAALHFCTSVMEQFVGPQGAITMVNKLQRELANASNGA